MVEESNDGNRQRITISPYDITTFDNLSLLITQEQLKGENYDDWTRSVRTTLRVRKKFGFIDGSFKKSMDDSTNLLKYWWTINSLLVSWI